VAEIIPGFIAMGSFALMAPPGTPPGIAAADKKCSRRVRLSMT
jgi:hypothetical protein